MMKEAYFQKMLTPNDLYFGPIYFIIVLLIALFIRNTLIPLNSPLRKYFMLGLIVKMFGAIGVGLVYNYYYGIGDTTQYFVNARIMYNAFSDSPYYFYKLLGSVPGDDNPAISNYTYWMYFRRDPNSWFCSKIYGFASIFAFGCYMPIALIMVLVTYLGVWSLYVVLCKLYPELYKQFAIAVLFIPSVFFWGSGILKDSITFSCVGFMTYAVYKIVFERKGFITNSLIFIGSVYLCLQIKPYILFSMLPAIVFWVFLHFRSKVKLTLLRFAIGPITVLCAAVFGVLIIQRLGADYTAYSISNAVKTAQAFQGWHEFLAEHTNASGYSLGNIDGSAMSIVLNIPAAINVTLFQPYPWQAKNPVMMLSAIESFLMLLFTIRIFYRTGIAATFRALFKNPTAFFCIFFALFFAFAVGFTAYNFGALVRYKIPCIPFYVAGLYILQLQTQRDKEEKKLIVAKKRHRFELQPA